ncbi:MAG: hypothetical protein KF735_02695 [Chelatococcus sp.]|uniref:hypothetical protein n=1 Tax=Chelatococcus sp. TaxID=1953771 RepID=UPI0025BF3535|nr:hypothetical protein [Chelatococcus sp.]MBX3536523.1 hypothetical protein [Chelatococcus sp.]
MGNIIETAFSQIGEFTQTLCDCAGDAAKSSLHYIGWGASKLWGLTGWAVESVVDGISWGISTALALGTGGWLLPALDGHDGHDADVAHSPSPYVTTSAFEESVQSRTQPDDLHGEPHLIGVPALTNAPDWHHA